MKLGLAALVALLAVAPPVVAAPPEQVVPAPGGDEAIIIPAGSPVKFARFEEEGAVARFTGRFVLTGQLTYGCEVDCDDPSNEADLSLMVVPDPALNARLPHWKIHTNAMGISIDNQVPIGRILANAEQRRALASGKLDHVTGRIAIVVDGFTASLDCDSANYRARYVRIVKTPKAAKIELTGDFGCG